jgi:hypothetical protein
MGRQSRPGPLWLRRDFFARQHPQYLPLREGNTVTIDEIVFERERQPSARPLACSAGRARRVGAVGSHTCLFTS